MKQHITKKQWDELDNYGKERLRVWIGKEGRSLHGVQFDNRDDWGPLLNMGQMIEFIDKNTDSQFAIFRRILDWKVESRGEDWKKKANNLCDALWEAVKYKLQNNK